MKLKQVCDITGLSRKTIRLYEEKALLIPRKERRNGREYREYTDDDVKRLRVIASLRRAWFTMEEIRQMQEDPATIGEILPQYRQWLLAQKSQLDGLLDAVERMKIAEIKSVEELSRQIEPETNKLPLPTMDIRPRFRYLDALEEPPRHVQEQVCFSESGCHDEATRAVLASQLGTRIGGRRTIDLYIDMMQEQPETVVPDQIDRDGKAMRFFKRLFELALAIGIFQLVREWIAVPVPKKGPLWPWILLAVVGGGLRVVLGLITWQKERSRLSERGRRE